MIAKVIKSLITFWKAKSNRLEIGGVITLARM